VTPYRKFVCRFMQFAGMCIMIGSGLLGIFTLITNESPWYFVVPFTLFMMAGGAGGRWLGRFIERELSNSN